MADTLRLEILSPSGTVFEGEISHVQAPGQDGYFGVLPHHTPMIAAMSVGKITAATTEGEKFFATSGGVAEVLSDRVIVLAETAEASSAIDIDRAVEARQRAEGRISTLSGEGAVDIDRARLALMRAINRISVAKG